MNQPSSQVLFIVQNIQSMRSCVCLQGAISMDILNNYNMEVNYVTKLKKEAKGKKQSYSTRASTKGGMEGFSSFSDKSPSNEIHKGGFVI